MPRAITPRTIAPPASRYAHGVVHSARARRLVTAGQVGMTIDGSLPEGFSAQFEQAWDNIEAILSEAGMTTTDLIRITVYSAVRGAVTTYRTVRDRRLGGHLVAATYLEVAGLASPDYLVEIEAEAVCEEPDLAFLEFENEAEIAVSAAESRASAREP
jgi:2-iminobutanoate/2-iminopropanoate deaminase